MNITQTFLSVSDQTERLEYNERLTNLIFGQFEFADNYLKPYVISTPNEERYYDLSFEKMSIIKILIIENPYE